MEELIYLAIVVGWFLLNAYKKSQEAKRKRQAEAGPMGEEHTEPQTDMQEMLRELMGIPKEPEPESVHVPQPMREVVRPRPMAVVNPISKKLRPTAENAAKAASDARSQRRVARAQQTETVGESGLVFDLRQAVIYDAVLQRPYS